jgi:hypothetical protein
MDKIFLGVKVYRQSGRAVFVSAGLALVAQALRIAAFIIADRALNIGLHPSLYLVIVPVTNLVEILPISLLGIGVRDVSIVSFFQLLGQSTEAGFALSLFVFITVTIAKLAGGVALMFSGQGSEAGHGIKVPVSGVHPSGDVP